MSILTSDNPSVFSLLIEMYASVCIYIKKDQARTILIFCSVSLMASGLSGCGNDCVLHKALSAEWSS